MRTNDDMIKEYINVRGLKKKSYYQLKSILDDYCKFQQLTLYELINEADREEEQRVRWKNRKIKTRLINYQLYLLERVCLNSVQSYLTKIKSFYHFHEIEIKKLPAINKKNVILEKPIKYSDLPTKEIIRTAVELSDPMMKALILFMSSSGCSRVDTLNFSVGDFVRATYDIHQQKDVAEAIQKLQDYAGDIIPTFNHRRSKNNKFFITFCTDEASREICNYLTIRLDKRGAEGLRLDEPLFKISPDWLTVKFQELNNIMKLGKVGNFNRFRSHMLRKFHASNLKKAGMDKYEINVMQGKSNGAVDDVYFFEDEVNLRENYIKYSKGLLIFSKVKEINVSSEEYKLLEQQNLKLKESLEDYRELKREIDEIKSWYIFD